MASSISTIKSDNFVKTPTTDAAQLIKGKVPGLSIITPDANPTSTSQIALRGITTLKASSSPLVLIDGIPGDLNSVSPDDIEQIDVLKDGSAAAIYGTERNKRRHIDYHQECQWRNAYGSRCQCLSFHPANHKDLAVHESRRISPTRTGRMAGSPRRRCINRLAGRSDPYTVHTDLQHQPARWQPYDQLCGQLRIPWSERPDQTYKQPMFYPRVEITHRMFNNKLKLNASLSGYKQTYFSGSDGGGYNSEVYRNALIYKSDHSCVRQKRQLFGKH